MLTKAFLFVNVPFTPDYSKKSKDFPQYFFQKDSKLLIDWKDLAS